MTAYDIATELPPIEQLSERCKHGCFKIDDLVSRVWGLVWTDAVCDSLLVNCSAWCVVFGTW